MVKKYVGTYAHIYRATNKELQAFQGRWHVSVLLSSPWLNLLCLGAELLDNGGSLGVLK